MRYLLFIYISLHASLAKGQLDTIYTNKEKIACSVKEVTPDAIQFTYPNETIVNSLYKNTIQKVVFRSGRTQVFSESSPLIEIDGIEDYGKVTITQVEGELKGLYKIGEVSSSSRGGTAYSNVDRVKERALNKLKMEAVMRGANLIYMAYQKTEGNRYGGYFQSAKAAETIYSGVAYSNNLLKKQELIDRLSGADFLVSDKQIVLLKGMAIYKAEYSLEYIKTDIRILRVYEEGSQLFVEAKIRNFESSAFRVVRFNDSTFTLLAEDKNKIMNFIVPFKSQ
ncbi:hypothetical protein [Spirosoma sp.]|uniref:hypothetical protein n=1 Tax=Spirosoma sp. TaxID=1899569 RepID=UPI002602263F|nr:hypothetical protein [Spirosoma sp.]MCX6214398.1 hypothetical protein [Spirosoma sp.]